MTPVTRTYYLSRGGKRMIAFLIAACLAFIAITAWKLTLPEIPALEQQSDLAWRPRTDAERRDSFFVYASVMCTFAALLSTSYLPRVKIDARGIAIRKWLRWTFCSWDDLQEAHVPRMHFGQRLPYPGFEPIARLASRDVPLDVDDYAEIEALLTPAGTYTHLTPLPEVFQLPDFAEGNDAKINRQGLVWKLDDATAVAIVWSDITLATIEWGRSSDGLCFLRFEAPQIPSNMFCAYCVDSGDVDCDTACPECDRIVLLLRFLHRHLQAEQMDVTER